MSTMRTPSALPALTRADRCDRCSARALIRALFPAGELLFCGHHARAHKERLSEIGATLTFAADSHNLEFTSMVEFADAVDQALGDAQSTNS